MRYAGIAATSPQPGVIMTDTGKARSRSVVGTRTMAASISAATGARPSAEARAAITAANAASTSLRGPSPPGSGRPRRLDAGRSRCQSGIPGPTAGNVARRAHVTGTIGRPALRHPRG